MTEQYRLADPEITTETLVNFFSTIAAKELAHAPNTDRDQRKAHAMMTTIITRLFIPSLIENVADTQGPITPESLATSWNQTQQDIFDGTATTPALEN